MQCNMHNKHAHTQQALRQQPRKAPDGPSATVAHASGCLNPAVAWAAHGVVVHEVRLDVDPEFLAKLQCARVPACARARVCVCVHMRVCVHTCVSVCTRVHACAYVRTCMRG